MDDLVLKNTTNLLLVKIHVITGWNFPSETEYREILRDQFRKKLLESYPNVNCDEVEFAFRKNTSVKDWGKNMNIALIDEVLIPYLNERFEASKLEEIEIKKLLAPSIPFEEISDAEIIEISKNSYFETGNWKFISYHCYTALGLKLDEDEKDLIRRQVKSELDSLFMEDKNLFKNISREKMTDSLCKKLAVAKYFDKNK